ncbi:MAG: adaptor protein MecA [Ruminococcaceae bacterium]|nr:adaptor protein MecA [Oscillospiraceae bacterium]
MELIRISDRKLKIMLTPMDMCHFELYPDRFGEDSEGMHRAFRLLLDEVRRQTDFDADDSRISVQYFPSREGGCEMFICNLHAEQENEESRIDAKLPSAKPCTELRPYKKRNGSFRRNCAYRFERLEHLLSACRRLLQNGGITESSVYRDEGGDYLLFVTVLATSPYSTPEELEFVVEYGSIENEPRLRVYIREHATLICPSDAVARMAELA